MKWESLQSAPNKKSARRLHTRDGCPKSPGALFVISTIMALLLESTSSFSFVNQPNSFQSRHRAVKGSSSHHRQGLYPHRSNGPFAVEKYITSTTLRAAKRASNDVDEWQSVLAALKMYNFAYGHLKVPVRFVVPSMAPWPENAWGMRLGQKVGAIRSTGRFIRDNDDRRQALERLGFVWRARAPPKSKPVDPAESLITFDQIYDALVVYRQVVQPEGPLSIPSDFVVPNRDPWPVKSRGLPLGPNMSKLQSEEFLSKWPGAKEKIQNIGVGSLAQPSAGDTRFQVVYKALARYKELKGDLQVPQPFVIPNQSPDWPEDTWGLRLGARVNTIRSQGTFVKNDPERRAMLDSLGFIWIPPIEGRRRGRNLKEDDSEASGSLGPKDSVENSDPNSDSSPSDLERELFGESMDGSEPISPDWSFEDSGKIDEATTKVKEPTEVAEPIYVPPPTMEETIARAKKLAIEYNVIDPRSNDKKIIKYKIPSDCPWFNDDFGGEWVFDDVVEALTLYKSFYGDFSNLTNDEFVIPMQGDEASNPFGDDMDTSRPGVPSGLMDRFRDSPGIPLSDEILDEEFERETVATAVPSSPEPLIDVEWPEYLGGMTLGNIVMRIRDGSLEVKHLPERKKKLDAIGFDWGDPKRFLDVPFEKAMCGMFAYYLIRGDSYVEEDFVIPDYEPWPEALAGYEVGKVVKRIRELQNFFEAFHDEKVGALRMIDFLWFPSMALPIDPNEPEMSPEMFFLTSMGHPDYTKVVDVPMGLFEKIIADGPFVEPEDPRNWWRQWHDWEYVKDYWYQQGRRDNGFVLRQMGYHQMADEHEAKYGPGIFQQIQETMLDLSGGIGNRSDGEIRELALKMKYYRDEMTDCTDLPFREINQLIEDIDAQLVALLEDNEELAKELDIEIIKEDGDDDDDIDEEVDESEYEYYEEEGEAESVDNEDDGEADGEEEDSEYEYEYEYEYEEEEYEDDVDVAGELGLDPSEEETVGAGSE